MSASEYVAEIRVTDGTTGSVIAAGSFVAGEAPRLIFDTSLTNITTIKAYARIEGAGGWWMDSYDVADLTYKHSTDATAAVVGSLRQPLTRNQSGKHNGSQSKIFGHTGSTKIKNFTSVSSPTTDQQITRIVFGDHDGIRSHPKFKNSHYFVGAYLIDQRGQLITNATYTWASTETGTTTGGIIPEMKPASDTTSNGDLLTGTSAATNGQETAGVVFLVLELPDYVTDFRLIWLCNPDGWWHIRGNTALIQG